MCPLMYNKLQKIDSEFRFTMKQNKNSAKATNHEKLRQDILWNEKIERQNGIDTGKYFLQ